MFIYICVYSSPLVCQLYVDQTSITSHWHDFAKPSKQGAEHPYNVAVLLALLIGAGKVSSACTEQLGFCTFAVLRKLPCRRGSYKVSSISG